MAKPEPDRRSEVNRGSKAASGESRRSSRRRGRRGGRKGPPPPQAKPASETEPPQEPPRRAKRRARRRSKPPAPSPAQPPAEVPAELRVPDGFSEMGLSEVMLDALAQAGYVDPTPVQAGLIPRALLGEDLMAQARTGTGKTAAFAIPILERLESHARGAPPQAIVLAPTRELAVQVRDECSKLAAGRRVAVVAVYGGKPIRKQTMQLQRGAELVVGTPGRVLDLMDRGTLVLDEVRYVVLDEADRMLDIGFRPDIEKILRRCPQSRQTLLLSATIPPPVMRLARRYMRDPEMLNFSSEAPAVETIEQYYATVDPERKFDLLLHLLRREDPTQAIIFCRTKRTADKVHRRLARKVDSVEVIHGDLPQSARDRVMRGFREGSVRHLVATDVVGRGIDVTRISHIINYDIPQFCDDYVHRVGRTGRMGREGVAFTFVTPEQGNELTRVEMRINRLLKRDEIPGFVAWQDAAPPEPGPPPERKPVFGRRTRRHRRAL